MQPFETVARARTPDGQELTLVRRGQEWVVRVGGITLMSSRQHDSEESLARECLAAAPSARAVLIGGLGLGFTLRAVLDSTDAATFVTVSELLPELVEWNRTHLAALHLHALKDPRCTVVEQDVLQVIEQSRGRFDAIMLDVDNGPVALTQSDNRLLYSERGVRACHAALSPGGVLGVWSAGPSPDYERRLAAAGFRVNAKRVAARRGGGAQHVIFLGTRE